MKSICAITTVLLFGTTAFAGNNNHRMLDWQIAESSKYIMASSDGANFQLDAKDNISLNQNLLARLGVSCHKDTLTLITMVLPEGVTPFGENRNPVKYSYLIMSNGEQKRNGTVSDWRKIVSRNNNNTIQTYSTKYPVEMVYLADAQSYYVATIEIEESDNPLHYIFSLNGYSEAVAPVLNACNVKY